MYEHNKRDAEIVWDPAKDRTNRSKHGVSFTEAATVFLDECGVLFLDPDESGDEERFILIGMSSKLRLLVVCHCYRESGQIVRIISARKADDREASSYAQH